jgi:hypothetical protein
MTSTARRVASRFRASFLELPDRQRPAAQVILSDGGIITGADIKRLLEPQLGRIVNVRLRPSLQGEPTTVAWEGLNERAELVSGLVVLHATVDTHEIVVWADLFVDERPEQPVRTARAPAQLLDDRLRRVANLARRLITTVRVRPDLPALEIVSDLVKIVEMAEGE